MFSISFCITCWNKDLHYLNHLLDDVKKQSMQPDEIIVVGNNIQEFPKLDEKIKSCFIKDRKPVSWSRNKCAQLSTKDIVIFFDVDDILHSQKIEITKKAFEQTDADCFVHGFEENVNANSYEEQTYDNPEFNRIVELIAPHGYLKIPKGNNKDIHHGHLAAKRSVILENPYNEFLGFYELGFQYWGEDTEICKRLFNLNYQFYYTPCKLILYRPSYQDTTRNWYKP